jgi:metal transporter CNNM
MTSGMVAIIGSTAGIVIFGEIIPQAFCSRHGLFIGYRTLPLTYLFMGVTGLISWPLGMGEIFRLIFLTYVFEDK